MDIKQEKEDYYSACEAEDKLQGITASNAEEKFTVKSEEIDNFNTAEYSSLFVKKEPFQCSICGREFKKRNGLSLHWKTHDKRTIHDCSVCKKEFRTPTELRTHMSEHAKQKTNQCSYCPMKFAQKAYLDRHEVIHTEKPQQCPVCKKMLKNSNTLRAHMNRHTLYETMCKEMSAEENYDQHSKPAKSFECDVCHRSFTKERTLKAHMTFHTIFKPFACDHCDETFKWKQELKIHERIHFTGGVKCIYCQRTVKFLHKHMQSQHKGLPKSAGTVPYCTICKKSFPNVDTLVEHVKTHQPKRRYECADCGMRFSNKNVLGKHLRIGHLKVTTTTKKKKKKLLHKCDICLKRFDELYKLKMHRKKHSSLKPFICELCKGRFNTLKALQIHMENHEMLEGSEKMCIYCTHESDTKRAMKKHLQTLHRGLPRIVTDFPFKCTVCRSIYNKLDDLKDHVKDHSDDFKCEICGLICATNGQFNAHVRTMHKNSSLGDWVVKF
ncbi:zinc finger protein OZF-like [Phlebotomus argentipes]|uniref:zinc finger protein OZF-like n=1 Tax=Phlebotomus argentipes TaxID=94469 RepID=UPI00289329D4|nr:zinc finger protein OZF-like [Phlebotomus argentipes]